MFHPFDYYLVKTKNFTAEVIRFLIERERIDCFESESCAEVGDIIKADHY